MVPQLPPENIAPFLYKQEEFSNQRVPQLFVIVRHQYVF
jgi:hypothetical protein